MTSDCSTCMEMYVSGARNRLNRCKGASLEMWNQEAGELRISMASKESGSKSDFRCQESCLIQKPDSELQRQSYYLILILLNWGYGEFELTGVAGIARLSG